MLKERVDMNWLAEVDKRKEELLQDLQGLLRIESTKDNATAGPGQPMGRNIAQALDYMLGLSEREQFRTGNLDGYIGYAEYGNEAAPEYVGVLCHLDVVPATGQWTTPPFEPDIRDGKLFARGAIDDKGPTMAAFYGLKLVKDLGLPLKRRVRVIFGTDEESGMECMKTYTEREKMPVSGFAPDADFPITHAEKGQINTKFYLRGFGSSSAGGAAAPQYELVRFDGGGIANMVPESAVAVVAGEPEALASLAKRYEAYCTDAGLAGTVEVGAGQATLHMRGKSAHGMEPHVGVNAALKLVRFLGGYSFQPDAARYIGFIDKHLVDDHLGTALGIACVDDITGPLTVNAGIFQYNGESAPFFHLNIRFPVSYSSADVLKPLEEKIAEYGIEMDREIDLKEPHHVDRNHPMIRTLQTIYEEETQLEPTLLTTGGGTYAAFLDNGVAFGALFPGREETAHQVDEYIIIDDLLKATAIYARAIYELANLED
ncbi:dipeptidase PepV [Paenibacillus thiaminolyticus]|nr:dipeptidase PepV [Paenibacillus thiaminolyticus]